MSLSLRALLAAASLAVVSTATAQTTLISENFESTSGSALPAGWTALANGGTVQTLANPYASGINTSGRVLQLSGPNANGGVGNIVSFNSVASPTLDLSSFYTGAGAGATANVGVDIDLSFQGVASANFGQLIAVGFADGTGTVYKWYAAQVNWNNQSFTTTGLGENTFNATTWWSASLADIQSALPAAGFDPSNFRLVFAHLDGANGTFNYATNYLDSVSLTAVPEPSTYAALAGVAALGLALLRRRRIAV